MKTKLLLSVFIIALGALCYARELQYNGRTLPGFPQAYSKITSYNIDHRAQRYLLDWYTCIGDAQVTVFMISLPFILSYV